MCSPISVTPGGATGGCLTGGNDGIVMAHIIALIALCGALMWNFRGLIGRALRFAKPG